MNKFPEFLLEDIYKKVKLEDWHPMEAVRTFGEMYGFKRNERAELFEAFAKYCEEK